MQKWLVLLCGGMAMFLASQSTSVQADDKGKALNIKKIMAISFDDEEGALEVISVEVGNEKPNWDKVSAKSKEWVKAVGDMSKNKPKKGSAESWEKVCKKFVDDVTAIDTAASKKDQKAVKDALKVVEKSCKACHSVHK